MTSIEKSVNYIQSKIGILNYSSTSTEVIRQIVTENPQLSCDEILEI